MAKHRKVQREDATDSSFSFSSRTQGTYGYRSLVCLMASTAFSFILVFVAEPWWNFMCMVGESYYVDLWSMLWLRLRPCWYLILLVVHWFFQVQLPYSLLVAGFPSRGVLGFGCIPHNCDWVKVIINLLTMQAPKCIAAILDKDPGCSPWMLTDRLQTQDSNNG